MNEPNKKLIIPENMKFQEYVNRPRFTSPGLFDTWIETETKFIIYHYYKGNILKEHVIIK